VSATASVSASAITTETDSTRTVRATVRGSKQQPKAGFGGAIRRLFRQAVKALTQRDPAPTPAKKSGRRRNGETRGPHFRRAANRLTRMRTRPAFAPAMLWLAETLDWLDLWHPGAGDELTGERDADRPNNHLSPRL
jgi:hypothetical protein